MNDVLLAFAVTHWSNARVFRQTLRDGPVDRRGGMSGPDPIETEVVKEIETDVEFGQAVVQVALGHPDPLVCAYALVALARSHFPGFEAILRRFDSDSREVVVHIGSFNVPYPLSEAVKAIPVYQSLIDQQK